MAARDGIIFIRSLGSIKAASADAFDHRPAEAIKDSGVRNDFCLEQITQILNIGGGEAAVVGVVGRVIIVI